MSHGYGGEPNRTHRPQPGPAGPPARGRRPAAGRYWAGVLASMVVAGLTGLVGVVVTEGLLELDLLAPPLDRFDVGTDAGSYLVAGALTAVLAGALLHLLIVTAPRPLSFFARIVSLLAVTAALVPVTLADDRADGIATGVLNLVIGLTVLSLLRGVVDRTT